VTAVVEVFNYTDSSHGDAQALTNALTLFTLHPPSTRPTAVTYRRRGNRPLQPGDVIACDGRFHQLGPDYGWTLITPPTVEHDVEPDHGSTPVPSPNRTPTTTTQQRSHTSRWPISAPDHRDWQLCAVLHTQHERRGGYRSNLFNSKLRTGHGVTEELKPQPNPSVRILDRSGVQFRHQSLDRFHDQALDVLRIRYDDGDPDVHWFFPCDQGRRAHEGTDNGGW
jgi:hypothetical protein